jgi:hypothetical protein
MRLAPTLTAVSLVAGCAGAIAKLPPLSDEAKAKAAETAAKTAWGDKVAAYQLCQSMDRVADRYRKGAKSSGKDAAAPIATPACTDPGPFVAAAPATPPSVNATSGQLAPKK